MGIRIESKTTGGGKTVQSKTVTIGGKFYRMTTTVASKRAKGKSSAFAKLAQRVTKAKTH